MEEPEKIKVPLIMVKETKRGKSFKRFDPELMTIGWETWIKVSKKTISKHEDGLEGYFNNMHAIHPEDNTYWINFETDCFELIDETEEIEI